METGRFILDALKMANVMVEESMSALKETDSKVFLHKTNSSYLMTLIIFLFSTNLKDGRLVN